MNERTLFLAWQDSANTRLWFPVGRLDAAGRPVSYRFRYTLGAQRAQREAGFPLLLEFPELAREYTAPDLFPLFQNRVINPRRPERNHYLRTMDLDPDASPIEILSTSGGRRATDAYEVFPKLVKGRMAHFHAVSSCTAGDTPTPPPRSVWPHSRLTRHCTSRLS